MASNIDTLLFIIILALTATGFGLWQESFSAGLFVFFGVLVLVRIAKE